METKTIVKQKVKEDSEAEAYCRAVYEANKLFRNLKDKNDGK